MGNVFKPNYATAHNPARASAFTFVSADTVVGHSLHSTCINTAFKHKFIERQLKFLHYIWCSP